MTKPRIFQIGVGALVLLITAIVSTSGQTAQSPLPPPTGYVNDYANVIDRATKQQLETTLANLDQQQKIQFSVVTVDTTGGREIFDYSLAVARGWGIGSKDAQKPSLLLLVAIKDHKYFTQVSRHLEGDLPDGLVGQIQRERLVPAFRSGDYGRGLTDTINEYITTVASKNGFSTDAIFPAGTKRPPEVKGGPGSSPAGVFGAVFLIFLVVIVGAIVVIIARIRGGRGGPRGGGGGWLTWLLVSLLLNSGRGSGSSGWSGGGFGGLGGGSSGGGFGGFGGGGDFGGGGAGGGW